MTDPAGRPITTAGRVVFDAYARAVEAVGRPVTSWEHLSPTHRDAFERGATALARVLAGAPRPAPPYRRPSEE